jgi:hypothetical protein
MDQPAMAQPVSPQAQAPARSFVRPAIEADLDAVVALRAARAWDPGAASSRGGFLLGSTREAYACAIARGQMLVVEGGRSPYGDLEAFSIVLSSPAFRASPLWARRHEARVPPDLLKRFETARLAYFDQLVARTDRGASGTRVAWHHVTSIMADHDAMLATTVVEPVVNPAAIPLLQAVGFEHIGHVDEVYPEIGSLRSALHLLVRDVFERRLASPRARRFALRLSETVAMSRG